MAVGSNIGRFKEELESLLDEGDLLRLSLAVDLEVFDEETVKNLRELKLPIFKDQCGHWYSASMRVVKQVLPDRLADFVKQYRDEKRKQTDFGTYGIADYMIGRSITRGYVTFVDEKAAFPKFEQQLNILKSAQTRLESSLFDMLEILQADPRDILERAREAVQRTKRPLLFGCHFVEDWPLAQQLEALQDGTVFTYCFRDAEQNLLSGGRIREAVWEARQRGGLFDVGHGMRSFSFPVAEAAIAEGFLPDAISSDQYRRHVATIPQHDLPRTLSKLMAAGMQESEVLTRVTTRPAEIMKLAGEVGTLSPEACADLAVLGWRDSPTHPLCDTDGNQRPAGCWEPLLTVRAG